MRWFAVRRAFFPAPASVFGTEVSDKRPPRNITCWGAAGCQSDGHQPPPDHLHLTNEHPAIPIGGAGLIPAAAGRGIRRFFRKLATGNSRNCTQRTTICARGSFMVYRPVPPRRRPSRPLSSTYYPWGMLGWAPVFRLVMGSDGAAGRKVFRSDTYFSSTSCHVLKIFLEICMFANPSLSNSTLADTFPDVFL